MKILFVLLFGLISYFSVGMCSDMDNQCEEIYPFKFNDIKKDICLLKKEKVLVSEKCLKSKKCQALDSISQDKLKNIVLPTDKLTGGKNPATFLCGVVGGRLIFATSPANNQEFFCEFNDKSMISTASQYMIYQNILATIPKHKQK